MEIYEYVDFMSDVRILRNSKNPFVLRIICEILPYFMKKYKSELESFSESETL
jgi:hypothetical protein